MALASGPSLAAGTARVGPGAPDVLAEWVRFGGALIVTLWLAGAVITTTSHGSRWPQLLGFGVGGAVFLYTTTPASTALAQHLGDAVYGCAVAWLAIEVCRSQGVRLRPGFAVSDAEQRRRTWMVTSLSYLICVVSGFLTAQITAVLRALGVDDALVVGLEQRSSIGVVTVADGVLAFVTTVAIEDVVIVAAVVTLLAAARRPAWQIYGVVCLVEIALHAYLGAVALTIAWYAAGRVWLYRRYGGVVPVVIGHFVFDLTVLANWLAPAPVAHMLAGSLAVAAVCGAAQLRTPRRGGER
ncbi:hypothetical protein [Streptomyces sp. VNUA24]|uniref:hypothetical protein n=1 Tax=Streptomyces sp. VNUA24 TaxID=3031131 RepID=UPI0023B882BA|nr:hypothetical protein [Streptomyces sp. VNUA24]WEH12328.1 hypothetical protein PYR72_00855 [Streptomyces sp. VNUA24]